MLKTVKPLKGKQKIEDLYKNGKKFYSDNISSIFIFDTSNVSNSNSIELAVTARKKTNKKAVTRNRIKRLLRESFRLEIKASNRDNRELGSISQVVLYWRSYVPIPKKLKLSMVQREVAYIINKARHYSLKISEGKIN